MFFGKHLTLVLASGLLRQSAYRLAFHRQVRAGEPETRWKAGLGQALSTKPCAPMRRFSRERSSRICQTIPATCDQSYQLYQGRIRNCRTRRPLRDRASEGRCTYLLTFLLPILSTTPLAGLARGSSTTCSAIVIACTLSAPASTILHRAALRPPNPRYQQLLPP